MTLREIAILAKVSAATVSRAINRVPSVNPVLARRIRKIIEKHGYYPNTNARALVRGHSRTLGLIVSEITNPFFPEIVQTFAKLGVQLNYEILLSSIDHDPRLLEITARQMIERRVGGVAILTFGGEAPLINVLTARNVEPSRCGSVRQVYPLKTNLVLRHSTALAPGCLRTEQQPQAKELIRTEACFESA